jgi:hypothetical protein
MAEWATSTGWKNEESREGRQVVMREVSGKVVVLNGK